MSLWALTSTAACLLPRQKSHMVFTHIITWPARSTLADMPWPLHLKKGTTSAPPVSSVCQTWPLTYMKSPQGLALSFNGEHRTPALQLLAPGSAWIKALHHRKRKQHMLGLFYMGLNGFLLMHACANVRFPWPPGTRDHTQPARGQDGHPHMPPSLGQCRRSPELARRAQWEDVVYYFSPWGKGARAARGEYHGPTHEARPMTDGSKSWKSK